MEFDIVANKNQDYSESNEEVFTVRNWEYPFNGASMKKKYWIENSYSLYKSRHEDHDFVQNAKICHIDGETTFHYRWGLDIHHISGLGGDGTESYKILTDNTPIGETRIIELKPEISEKVKLYYR